MKPKVGILIVVAVALVAAFVGYRHCRTDAHKSVRNAAKKPPSKAKKRRPAPAPTPTDRGQTPPPELVFDDDPKGPLRLEGQVLDSQDAPVAGAQVAVNSNPARTVKTESDGSFGFDSLLPRAYSLTARHGNQVGGPVVHKLSEESEPVAIRLVAGATLTVTTTDENGAAVAGARVTVRQDDERDSTTDERGQVRFAGVARGGAVIVVYKIGYGQVRRLTIVPDGGERALDVQVVLRPGAALAGRVIDESGQPVKEARVSVRTAAELLSAGSARSDHVLTGSDGRFELPALSAGSYRLRAVHKYLAPAVSPPIALDGVTARRDIELVMKAGGVLAGTVLDATGRPAAHAHVRVREDSSARLGGSSGRTRQATADDRGAFHISALPRVAMTVLAISDQASSEVIAVDLRENPTRDNLTLTLSITGTITGIVRDGQGEPVAEAQVTALPDFFSGESGAEFAIRGMAAATTDGGGGFALTGLAEGKYQLRAARSSVRTASFKKPGVPATTGDTGVQLTLETPGSLTGKLQFADGSAPEAFTVTVAFPPGTPVSNKTGAFTIRDIPDGKHDVTFRGPGFQQHRVSAVEVNPGQATDMGTIEVTRGRHVSGRVLTESGTPVAGATVVVARQLIGDGKASIIDANSGIGESLGLKQTTTDGEGRFFISGISRQEQQLIGESFAPESAGRSVPTTIPGGEDDVTYELVLRPFGSVSGLVTVDGKPAAGANVIAAPQDGGNQMLIVTAGDDGRYAYERLARGPHRLTASISQGLLGGASSAAYKVDIVPDQNATVDIAIAVGDVAITVTVKGVDDAKIDLTQLFLIKGQHAPTNAKQLTETFLRGQSGGVQQKFAPGTNPVTFKQVIADQYSLCAIPINGDLRDVSFTTRLQEQAEQLKVYCQVEVIPESPKEQSIVVVVPPMEPLVDPQSEQPAP